MLCFDPFNKDIYKIATLYFINCITVFCALPQIMFSVYQRLQIVNNVLQRYHIFAALSSFLQFMRAFSVGRILESRIALYAPKKEA